mgnify:CR=1 FL=1|tara:strand:+ start:5440 stop:6051 length:612 start_codon:yes stop_codon:yes gene_type:complete
MAKKAKGVDNRSAYKRAQSSKHYNIVRPLLDRYGIKVRKWMDYDTDTVYWADFDSHTVVLPIPDCDWSLYICLHEIGHLVKGSRSYTYLHEYHAEQYALSKLEKLEVKGLSAMTKSGKKYVMHNVLQDMIFYDLNPNSVRREVRAWLGVTPKRLRTLALRRCTMIMKKLLTDHSAVPFGKISRDDKEIVKQRKQEIYEIEPNN